jgi:DNA-binding transcriptional regulator YiaG
MSVEGIRKRRGFLQKILAIPVCILVCYAHMDFSTRFKEARKKLAITQEKAAVHFKVSLATIQNWEMGKKEPVGYNRERVERLLRKIEGLEK